MTPTVEETQKHVLSSGPVSSDDVYETNDIKLATALIASGHGLVMVRHVKVKKGNRVKGEVLFGFRHCQDLHDVEITFLSGRLTANALGLLDIRDRIISYIANSQRSMLNPMAEEVINKSHGR